MVTESAIITPTAPFDFSQTLEYLSDFSIAAGEQTIEGGRLTRAIAVNGSTTCEWRRCDARLRHRSELWVHARLVKPDFNRLNRLIRIRAASQIDEVFFPELHQRRDVEGERVGSYLAGVLQLATVEQE
jgi:hypothetical protein